MNARCLYGWWATLGASKTDVPQDAVGSYKRSAGSGRQRIPVLQIRLAQGRVAANTFYPNEGL